MTLTTIFSVATSLIASIIYATVGGGYRRWFGRRIEITDPARNGYLAPVELRRGVKAHRVSGTLKYLPKNYKIWLVVADEAKGKFWPQGFEPVDYDEKTGAWTGFLLGNQRSLKLLLDHLQ